MKNYVCIIIFLSFLIILANCSNDVNEPRPGPNPPTLWPAFADSAMVEKGIDAVPEANWIKLDWSISDKRNTKELNLYRLEGEEKNFSLIKTLSYKDSTWIDNSVELYHRYFYYLRAIDRKGNLGAPSDTVDYMLLNKAQQLSVTSGVKPKFLWVIINPRELSQYIIKVFTMSGEKVWFATVTTDFDGTEEAIFNFDNSAKQDSLSKNEQYVWRIDIVGIDPHSGSESEYRQLIP